MFIEKELGYKRHWINIDSDIISEQSYLYTKYDIDQETIEYALDKNERAHMDYNRETGTITFIYNVLALEKDKEYYFTFEVKDISVPYDLTLEVRNNNLYPYQNLWLFCSEEQPIGPLRRDTIECMLADEFGKWHGHGISLYQSSFPIHSQYKFPHAGQYTFSFRQGMRDDALKGIQEIGFSVRLSR